MEVLIESDWTENVTTRLKDFEHLLLKAMKEQGWDGVEGGEAVNWTFTGALFYAITVITTIGYGHIAPKTAAAKIVTIFYAILGIPLTVLCWSNIGDAMANAFRYLLFRQLYYLVRKIIYIAIQGSLTGASAATCARGSRGSEGGGTSADTAGRKMLFYTFLLL